MHIIMINGILFFTVEPMAISPINKALLVSCLLTAASPSFSQVFMDADSTGDAYGRILSKKYGYEVPDCKHAVRHITEEWDAALKKYVFAFSIHRDLDDDRCINFDRQRCEIKTDASSPDTMKAAYGETHTYRWKFKLDAGFQPSPNFCHIHQIKAGDGADADNPLMTITPRYGNPSKLQVIFVAPASKGGGTTYLKEVDLSPFKGVWIEAQERAKFTEDGTYELTLKRVSDDSVLLSYNNSSIAMWRDGSTFIRPKYGIYRSLNSPTYLRDESVWFADFSLAEGVVASVPAPPGTLKAQAASGGQIELTWKDNSSNEDQFRIERSIDGFTWAYLTTASAARTSCSDTGLASSKRYYYRIRSENAFGNSGYSNIADATTKATTGIHNVGLNASGFELLNYPNPFNPSTCVSFTIPKSGFVTLKVFDVLGREAATLLSEERDRGTYSVQWNASNIPSGVYVSRLESNGCIFARRMMLVK